MLGGQLTRRTEQAILYVMHTKLTLRMDDALIRQAKAEARRRGKSVSQMFGDFVQGLSTGASTQKDLPPVTSALVGVLKGQRVSEADYKQHLRKKYL